MRMSRKDYDAIAQMIKETLLNERIEPETSINQFIPRLIEHMRQDNPRFDKALFEKAMRN